jgi:dipeptidase E
MMKLFLTSAGITNPTLAAELKRLVKKNLLFAFIPTAANLEQYDKGWLIKNYNECEAYGKVDIVDVSAIPKKHWLPRLKKANVIVMGGGNTPYLLQCLAKSGLNKELPTLLKDRVYMGISAGSIATNRNIATSSQYLYGEHTTKAPKGLGLVDIYVRPHLNNPKFPRCKDGTIKKLASKFDNDLYAIDDNTAIVVDNGKITVVSEGRWVKYARKN